LKIAIERLSRQESTNKNCTYTKINKSQTRKNTSK